MAKTNEPNPAAAPPAESAPQEKGAPKQPKLLKYVAKEPMGELVRGEMVRVLKGEVIELTPDRAKAISFLVDPVA